MKNMGVLVPHLAWNLDLPRLRMSRKNCPVLSDFVPCSGIFLNGTFFGAGQNGTLPPPPHDGLNLTVLG